MRVGPIAALLLGAGLLLAAGGARGHLSNEQEQEHPDETNQQHQQQPPSSLQPAAGNLNTHHLQQQQQQSQQPREHHDQVQQQQQQHGQQHHNQDLHQVDQMHQQQQQQHVVAPHFAPESSTQRFELASQSDAFLATPMQQEGQQQQHQPQQQQQQHDHLAPPIHFDQGSGVMDQLDKQRPALSNSQQQSNNLVQQSNQVQLQQQQPAKVHQQEQQTGQLMGGGGGQQQQQSPLVQAIRQGQQMSKPQMPMQSFQAQQPQAQQTQQQQQQQLQTAPVPPYQQQAAGQVQGAQALQQQQQATPLRRAQLQKGQASAPMLNSNQQQQQQQMPSIQQQQQQQQQQPSPMMMNAPQQQPQAPQQQQQQQYQPMQSQQQANLMQQQASLSIVQAQLLHNQQQQQQQQLVSKYQPSIVSPLYLGHNPFIEILRPLSYADDNIVTLNLSHSHIYEIDSDAFVGQRFEHIDLSNNKLGLIHSRSFRIGPNHSRHTPFDPLARHGSGALGGVGGVGGVGGANLANGQVGPNNLTKFVQPQQHYATRRPPPAHPKSVTIDFSHNPAIVALSGAFDHIDVPNCLLNFTNSTVELKFGAFKKYFKEHPGHIIDIDTVDCCDQEWLLGYKHNFVSRTHCAHDPNLYLLKVSQQTIIDSCIAYVTSARHNLIMPSSGIIHTAAANGPRHPSGSHPDNQQYLTYLILGGTAMVLTSLSIYIIFYMFSLKAAFVYSMQTQKN